MHIRYLYCRCIHDVRSEYSKQWMSSKTEQYILKHFSGPNELWKCVKWKARITMLVCSYSPTNKCCNNDTPGSAATVRIRLLLVFFPPAAQPNGIEEQEQEVQSQTGKRQTSQQENGLMDRRT